MNAYIIQWFTNQILTNQHFTNQILTNQHFTNQILTDQLCTAVSDYFCDVDHGVAAEDCQGGWDHQAQQDNQRNERNHFGEI
jgi:hypothetical protein